MASQTTGGFSWRNASVQLSVDGATWLEASGHSNALSQSGGDRVIGEQYTNAGDTPIIQTGKRAPITLTFDAVATETASEPYELARAAYENNTPLYIRWSPKGGGVGTKEFTSGSGVVKSPVYPVGKSTDAAAILIKIVLVVPSVTETQN